MLQDLFEFSAARTFRLFAENWKRPRINSDITQSCTIGLSFNVSIHFFSIWTLVHGNPTELLLLAWPPIEAAPELRPLWQAQQTLHFKFRPAAAGADVIGDGVAAASFCCFF